MERQTPYPCLRPEDAPDAAAFVELMRAAKERSGLTYRELEARAAAHGDVLARSTLANALARNALPRADLVAAFVRACEGEERVPAWLAARDRLALLTVLAPTGQDAAAGNGRPAGDGAPVAPRATGAPPDASGAPQRRLRRLRRLTALWRRLPRPWRLPLGAAAGLAVLLLAGLGVHVLTSEARDPAGPGLTGLPTGPVELRPALSPELCLTDGFTRDGRYDSQVAVHRPCTQAVPPVTELVPAGDDTYRVSWRHPEHGVGCLTALTGDRLDGLLEPRDDCSVGTRFRVLPAPPGSGRSGTTPVYLVSADSDRCVGAAETTVRAGTEAKLAACDGSRAQRYLLGAAQQR